MRPYSLGRAARAGTAAINGERTATAPAKTALDSFVSIRGRVRLCKGA